MFLDLKWKELMDSIGGQTGRRERERERG